MGSTGAHLSPSLRAQEQTNLIPRQRTLEKIEREEPEVSLRHTPFSPCLVGEKLRGFIERYFPGEQCVA